MKELVSCIIFVMICYMSVICQAYSTVETDIRRVEGLYMGEFIGEVAKTYELSYRNYNYDEDSVCYELVDRYWDNSPRYNIMKRIDKRQSPATLYFIFTDENGNKQNFTMYFIDYFFVYFREGRLYKTEAYFGRIDMNIKDNDNNIISGKLNDDVRLMLQGYGTYHLPEYQTTVMISKKPFRWATYSVIVKSDKEELQGNKGLLAEINRIIH